MNEITYKVWFTDKKLQKINDFMNKFDLPSNACASREVTITTKRDPTNEYIEKVKATLKEAMIDKGLTPYKIECLYHKII